MSNNLNLEKKNITLSDIQYIYTNFSNEINKLSTLNLITKLKSKYIGKNGILLNLIKELLKNKSKYNLNLINEINNIKNKIIKMYLLSKNNIININNNLSLNNLNINLPGRKIKIGSLHPISIVINDIKNYFSNMGFILYESSEIENIYNNFDALNIPKNHPSRSKSDTFWINKNKILRTHTSCCQIRFAKKNKPPFKIMSYGKVYRNDRDRTHTPMFHQFEGFIIDKNINLVILKKILYNFIIFFFNKKNIKIRYRPSYFPFTEPSIEIDIFYKSKWIEILGCGLININVLKNMNIDINEYSGLAFGIGLERLTMIKYNISDIKILFENNINFLSQFLYMR